MEVLTLETTRMNLEDSVLSEISQSQRAKYDPTYMRSLEESASQRQEVGWWVPGAGGGWRVGV